MKNPKTRTHSNRLILYLTKPLVDRCSALSHASQCMTTSRSAAATQSRVRVSPAMHPRYFYAGCPSCRNHPIFGLEDQLRICWLAYTETKLHYSLTHSLTAALDQLRVVASSTSNDPGPRSRQHQHYLATLRRDN